MLSWHELRVLIRYAPPSPDLALYRAQNPKSWWWTPDFDMWSLLLLSLQGANWQRSGGDEDSRPQLLSRPLEDRESVVVVEDPDAVPVDEIADELARRRKQISA